MADISIKGSSPILHGRRIVGGKQKHPVKDFPEETAAKKKTLGPGQLKQRSFKKGGKV